jgi:Uma2 family endonuclease
MVLGTDPTTTTSSIITVYLQMPGRLTAMSVTIDARTALDVLRRELLFAEGEQRTVLREIQWGTFEQILADRGEKSTPRLFFDRGDLEILSPSDIHEDFKETITYLLIVACEETNTTWRALGSFTHERADLQRAVEPDVCFYIQSEPLVRGKRIDLAVDPTPDLAVEIDITSSSIDKLSLYAALGTPELWRYDGRALRILTLQGGKYELSEQSKAFAWLPASRLTEALAGVLAEGQHVAGRTFREWVRQEWMKDEG